MPETFRWTDESWGAGLRCLPLEAIAPHVFTTRQLQLTGAEDVDALATAIGASRAMLVSQVHGNTVVVVRDGEPLPESRPEADALIANAADVAIVVRVADCTPILIADRATRVVGAVHAGWRGTAAGIVTKTVEALAREFGSRPEDLVAAIGPSIGACCYEVGSELVDAFAAAGYPRHLIDRWFIAPPPPRGPFPKTAVKPRLRLDVAGANRDQLVLAGVPEAQIFSVGLCTAMHLDVLTSFRIEREQAGRLAAAIRVTRA